MGCSFTGRYRNASNGLCPDQEDIDATPFLCTPAAIAAAGRRGSFRAGPCEKRIGVTADGVAFTRDGQDTEQVETAEKKK
ncbi:hypothetical protein [Sorangium sp. So ce362]|uniref:hypothetical protein n=1 Tax=Sorangium sp. So ce362 TaxID=3133303 RepID=UPI003F61A005